MAKPVSYTKTPEDEDVTLEMVEPSIKPKSDGDGAVGLYLERSGSKKKIDYVLVFERCQEKEDEDEESRAKSEKLEEVRKAFETSLDKAGLLVERVERTCSKVSTTWRMSQLWRVIDLGSSGNSFGITYLCAFTGFCSCARKEEN